MSRRLLSTRISHTSNGTQHRPPPCGCGTSAGAFSATQPPSRVPPSHQTARDQIGGTCQPSLARPLTQLIIIVRAGVIFRLAKFKSVSLSSRLNCAGKIKTGTTGAGNRFSCNDQRQAVRTTALCEARPARARRPPGWSARIRCRPGRYSFSDFCHHRRAADTGHIKPIFCNRGISTRIILKDQ